MDILIYLLKTNLCLVVFYGFYWVFLRRNTFFASNRFYLLLAVMVSCLLPFLKVKHNYNFQTTLPYTFNELPIENLESVVYQPFIYNINWVDILAVVYLIGVGVLLARMGFAMIKIYLLLINGDPIGEEETRTGRNYWLLRSNEAVSSYSFFNFLILNREDLYYNKTMITDHEEVHIGQWHSFDVLLMEFIQIFCWFNPVVRLYKESIRKLHEFIADDIVEEPEKVEYAEFLFAYNFKSTASSLGNNFFKDSLLKERIAMMMKQRSSVLVSLRYFLIIPMLALIGYFVVVKDVRRGEETQSGIKQVAFRN